MQYFRKITPFIDLKYYLCANLLYEYEEDFYTIRFLLHS
jgi:hypothetical protein